MPRLRKPPHPILRVFGNRGIYHEGWLAGTVHNVPWIFNAKLPALDDDVWELYDLRTDFTSAVDLASSNRRSWRR